MPRIAKSLAEIQSYARSFDRSAINVLAGIMRQKTAPAAARVLAANSLLDRGWGKAEQQTSLNAEIQITIRKIFEGAALPGIDDDKPNMIDVSPNADNQQPATEKQKEGEPASGRPGKRK